MKTSTPATIEQARAAKLKLLNELRGLRELSGVGVYNARPGYGVRVSLSANLPKGRVLPEDVHGVPVWVVVVGPIRALKKKRG